MKELQAFRQGFCNKAAELGILPSELLAYSRYKQAFFHKEVTSTGKDVLDAAESATRTALLLGSFAFAAGLGGGALGNYLYNKAKFQLDPDDSILPSYSAVDEAKKLHLLAKYRNAKKMVNAGLS
jgi:hypothetical protein